METAGFGGQFAGAWGGFGGERYGGCVGGCLQRYVRFGIWMGNARVWF